MPTVKEFTCCKEILQVVEKVNSYEKTLDCITEHPGFRNLHAVLETADYQFRQQYLREGYEDERIS